MIPVQFPESNGVLARDQGEYEPLPIYHSGDAEGRVAFCCRLSDAEIDEIRRTRTLDMAEAYRIGAEEAQGEIIRRLLTLNVERPVRTTTADTGAEHGK